MSSSNIDETRISTGRPTLDNKSQVHRPCPVTGRAIGQPYFRKVGTSATAEYNDGVATHAGQVVLKSVDIKPVRYYYFFVAVSVGQDGSGNDILKWVQADINLKTDSNTGRPWDPLRR